MEELKQAIEKLSSEELERANKKFKMFSSPHEGYAVILEELEEAYEEIERAKMRLDLCWHRIRINNKNLSVDMKAIKQFAINAAAEAVQVAAMAQKFIDSSEVV